MKQEPRGNGSVLTIGSVNADVIIEIKQMPLKGETISASNPKTGMVSPGGKGANQAAGIARLSSQCTQRSKFICQFGNDAHGSMLKKTLEDLHVDVTLAGYPTGSPSGQAFVFLYPDGQNSIIIVGGANAAWPPSLTTEVEQAIQSSSLVLLQMEIPQHINEMVAKFAHQHRVPVMWDMGGEERVIPIDVLPLITFLCPNETELARLVQQSVTNKEEAVAAARTLQNQGAGNVLVTLGSAGSVFVPHDVTEEVIHQPIFRVGNVVDTTGAGDCFRSAFAVAISEGKTIRESLTFAAAASALCVQVKGAMHSFPTYRDTIDFLENNQ